MMIELIKRTGISFIIMVTIVTCHDCHEKTHHQIFHIKKNIHLPPQPKEALWFGNQ
jgi:hypothetical protein